MPHRAAALYPRISDMADFKGGRSPKNGLWASTGKKNPNRVIGGIRGAQKRKEKNLGVLDLLMDMAVPKKKKSFWDKLSDLF